MTLIAVGSTNPVKIQASIEVAELVWQDPEVVSADVASGISDQPTAEKEAIRGAGNRAERARGAKGSDFGVGLEGSTYDSAWGMFLTGWSVVTDRERRTMLGGGGRLRLPDHIAQRVRGGEELGDIMDEVEGREGIKEGIGAIGVFTGELRTRKDAYKEALIFSLAHLLKPKYYEE